MFNYFACRKLAEAELQQSVDEVLEHKKQEKMRAMRDKLAKRYKLRIVGFIKNELKSESP